MRKGWGVGERRGSGGGGERERERERERVHLLIIISTTRQIIMSVGVLCGGTVLVCVLGLMSGGQLEEENKR